MILLAQDARRYVGEPGGEMRGSGGGGGSAGGLAQRAAADARSSCSKMSDKHGTRGGPEAGAEVEEGKGWLQLARDERVASKITQCSVARTALGCAQVKFGLSGRPASHHRCCTASAGTSVCSPFAAARRLRCAPATCRLDGGCLLITVVQQFSCSRNEMSLPRESVVQPTR